MNSRMLGTATALMSMAMLAGLPGCSSSGNGDSAMTGSMTQAPADDMVKGPIDEMTDLGEWEVIVEERQQVGVMHSVHGLSARYNQFGENPRITASAPAHQPTVAGTWRGRWGGYVDGEPDEGPAQVHVTIRGGNVGAVLTYEGVDGIGSVASDRVPITDGRFTPTATLTVDGVLHTYSGQGQFGGTDQRSVVGYVGGTGLRSVFYGDRN